MSNTNDAFTRSVALEKAMVLYKYKDSPTVMSPDQIIQAAEKFRAFLSGQDAKPEPSKAKEVTIRTPRENDGYVYFQFMNSTILYRAETSYGSMAGGVDRINLDSETRWQRLPVTHPSGTRYELWIRKSIRSLTAKEAAKVMKDHLRSVRFL